MAHKPIELDELTGDIESMVGAALIGLSVRQEARDRVYGAVNITKDIHAKSESVPEFKFSKDLLELLLQNGHWLMSDSGLTDEELTAEGYQNDEGVIEMMVNPRHFQDGKIRPDVAFRKNPGEWIIFEIDSFQYHSNQKQITADKVRERKIQSLGHPVFRFSAKEVLDYSWGAAIEAYKILEEKGFIIKKEVKSSP